VMMERIVPQCRGYLHKNLSDFHPVSLLVVPFTD
jgi:hypothetical protein